MGMKRKTLLALAAVCGLRAGAETWTWIGGSHYGWSGGKITANVNRNRDWQDGYNWRDSSGERGGYYAEGGRCPANGDTLVFDTDVKNEYTHCWGGKSGIQYAAVVVRGSADWINYYGSQPNVQDGGSMRLESAIAANLQYVYPKGEMTVHVADGGTLTLAYLKDDGTTVRPVVKTGGGTWRISSEHGSFWTTLDLRGGAVRCMTNNQLNATTSFTFNGPGTRLNINGFNQVIADAALAESAAASGHAITSPTAACLTLSGAQDDTTFSGNVSGAVSICWKPSDATKTLTLSALTLDTTGTLVVSNGVLKLGANEVLPNGLLDIEGGKLEVPEGSILFMRSGSVTQGDAAVADGTYGGEAGPGRTAVSWMAGSGLLMVGDPTGGTSASANWTGTGPMTTAVNWDGAAELPDIYSGTLCMSVTGGESATVDTNAWLNGIAIASDVTAFSFLPSSTHILWLGAQGLTTPGVRGTYNIQAPLGILGAQTWTVGANDKLALKAPLTTVMGGTVTMGGTGTYSFEAGSPDLANDLKVTSGTVHVKADYALGGASGTTSFTNATVKFFGTTQVRPLAFSNKVFTVDSGTTNVFNGKVFISINGTLSNAGTEIFAGGLDFGYTDTIIFTNGVFVVTNMPITGGASRRHNVTSGALHLFAPSNAVNINQQGWVSGEGRLYTHVTNAIHASNMNLSGNQPGGAVWDLCGCDQRVANIQCGRGNDGTGATAVKWKTSTQPGTIRSDLPAVLHLADAVYSIRPSNNSSPSSTNWAYFVGQAGISKEGTYKSHWLLQECSSSGIVQVTQGELYIAKRHVDGAGNDYGQGSWPNASKAVAKGAGTLVFQHSACIGKTTDVELHAGGKLRLEEGVRQLCRDLYLPDGEGGLAKQALGTWGSTASGAAHRNDTYFAGAGQLIVIGDGKGCLLIFR